MAPAAIFLPAQQRAQALDRNLDLLSDYLNLPATDSDADSDADSDVCMENEDNEEADGGARAAVRAVLDSAFVRPFFAEYARDYLARTSPDRLEAVALGPLRAWCAKHDAFGAPAYTLSSTSSRSSSSSSSSFDSDSDSDLKRVQPAPRRNVLDHAARFVVRVLQHSWRWHEEKDGVVDEDEEGGEEVVVSAAPWTCGAWDPDDEEGEAELEFWQVWLVLRHLQAEWEAAHLVESRGELGAGGVVAQVSLEKL